VRGGLLEEFVWGLGMGERERVARFGGRVIGMGRGWRGRGS